MTTSKKIYLSIAAYLLICTMFLTLSIQRLDNSLMKEEYERVEQSILKVNAGYFSTMPYVTGAEPEIKTLPYSEEFIYLQVKDM